MDLSDFKRPINVVSLAVGAAGLVLSGIFYISSVHSAAISYHVATIQIVDQKEAVPFSVIDNAGQHVGENVYATNVTVWNSGDLPVEPQNIRSPLTISVTAPVRVLDAKLARTTSNNISEFKVDNAQLGIGSFQVTWKYFDPREGFRLRLIYASKDVRPINLEGTIFGFKEFYDITPLPQGTMSLKQRGAPQLILALLIMIGSSFWVIRGRFRGARIAMEHFGGSSCFSCRL